MPNRSKKSKKAKAPAKPIRLDRSWVVALVARFAVLYGVFLAASIWLPVYAYVEWGAAIAVDAMLAFTGDGVVTRELGFESATSGFR